MLNSLKQNEKFDKIINEYKKYISDTNDKKKKKLYREWLDKIIELKDIMEYSTK